MTTPESYCWGLYFDDTYDNTSSPFFTITYQFKKTLDNFRRVDDANSLHHYPEPRSLYDNYDN